MNHLTNFYKNKCEQLQEQVNNLQKLLNEVQDTIPDYELPPGVWPHTNDPQPDPAEFPDWVPARFGDENSPWPSMPSKPYEEDKKAWDKWILLMEEWYILNHPRPSRSSFPAGPDGDERYGRAIQLWYYWWSTIHERSPNSPTRHF